MIESNSLKMKLFVVGCLFMAYFGHVLLANQKGCTISLHGTHERNSPILLRKDNLFIVTQNGNINLKTREQVWVLCADPKNHILGENTNLTLAQCVKGDTLRIHEKDLKYEELQCQKTIRGSVLETSKKCGTDERVFKIGYQVRANFFGSLIQICYNTNSGFTFYTQHFIYGNDIKHASKSNFRPSFSVEGSSVSASVAYKQAFQQATFSKLLKSAALSRQYIHEKSFLARGHLSPDADFLLASWQYTSYYYINTAPQWQVINAGNWKRVEGMARKSAERLNETLLITTGTHEVLSLPDNHGKLQEIYLLSEKKLPVPKFFWKIVHSEKNNKAIVLVSLNNPFITEIHKEDLLCKDVCEVNDWGSSTWSDFSHGFIYCCDYSEFKKVVQNIPHLRVVGLLQGPNKIK